MDAAVNIPGPKALGNPESRFFNRELSWLEFNNRVLEEASNKRHPLLERLRFLSISGNNLDEFFMVRVAGLKGQQLQGVEEQSVDGLTPAQQLSAILESADRLMDHQQAIWEQLKTELAQVNFYVVSSPSELNADELEWLRLYFVEQIFPILTPQALDPAHPFPFVPNKGFGLVFELESTTEDEKVRELLMLPSSLRRFVQLPGSSGRYIAIETIIRCFIKQLFPGYTLLGDGAFRIIRDSDIELEEEAEDLVRFFRSALQRRRRGRVIRLKLERGMPDALRRLLMDSLITDEAMVSEVDGIIGISDLSQLVDVDRPELKFSPYTPRFPERIREHDGDCFAAIQAKDIVVHHPYESFDVVLAFLRQAAADPDVVAIKQTLYRAGKQSAVIRALIDAAEAGKSVTAVVELKARFDEEQNLVWAAQLERAGVQVVYGFIEWKTHAKVSMVVRREADGFRTYCHFGTGNYHPITARIYTDLSFFTADPGISRDAAQLFNYITGYIPPTRLESLVMSPMSMRKKLADEIEQEIKLARAGRPASIWAKMNSLVDPAIIDKLYEASEAGVEIDLIVRGICCLRPGIEGLSSRIRVRSIVGRFLEHSRIMVFGNGEALPSNSAKVYISSADWMPRNFDRRIEYMLPIENPTVHAQILDQVMVANLLDTEQSWILQSDGSYKRLKTDGKPFNLHKYFMTNPSLSGRGAALESADVIPHLSIPR